MTFELAPIVIRNSGIVGANVLTDSQLYKFSDGLTTTSGVLVSGTIAIDAVLINRYKISEIRYYYSGPSDISFYSSQNGDVWDSLSFSSGTNYASVSGALSVFDNWPSVIRVVQTDLAAESFGYELVVESACDEIGFGLGGESTFVEVDCSVDSEVSEIPVKNLSEYTKDIFCFVVDSDANQTDEAVAISNSITGPFSYKWQNGIQIPRDFDWNSGGFSGTVVSGACVELSLTSGTGYYYTPVVETTGMLPIRVYWTTALLPNTSVDWLSQPDNSNTAAVRWSSLQPSGSWLNGNFPETNDIIWGSLSGTLAFVPVSCATILPTNPPGCRRFFQAGVRLNSQLVGTSPALTSVGFEEATVLSGVLSGQTGVLYAKTSVSSYARGSSSDIITFFLE